MNLFPKPTLIPVNGVELEVFEAGQQNAGNPIVLCHGWPEHAFSWRHQMPVLAAAGYHVIVPNQRGYGNSSQFLRNLFRKNIPIGGQSRLWSLDSAGKAARNKPSDFKLAGTAGCRLKRSDIGTTWV